MSARFIPEANLLIMKLKWKNRVCFPQIDLNIGLSAKRSISWRSKAQQNLALEQ